MKKHLLIFIHGVGEGASTVFYQQLIKNLRFYYSNHNSENIPFDHKFMPVFVEWQKYISDAERVLFKQCFPRLNPDYSWWDIFSNPVLPLRHFMTFFMGDVTAYVSENDNKIRRSVWHDMERALESDSPYSIIAHSLGSVVAFDYLFNLFERNCLFLPDYSPETNPEQVKNLQDNFRHFFSFGSPIGLFMMRNGKLWMDGKNFRSIINPVRGENRQWLNFYDRQDVIAYPLETLFSQNPDNAQCHLQDIRVQTGNFVYNSHLDYWKNKKLAEQIVKALS